jgi:hypothetical protein
VHLPGHRTSFLFLCTEKNIKRCSSSSSLCPAWTSKRS